MRRAPQWKRFSKQVSGKWVLLGEHAVLRGSMAIALPHQTVELSIHFEPHPGQSFSTEPASLLPWVESGLATLGIFQMPEGHLTIQSTIPMGAGLGSSAALCVSLVQWLAEPLQIPSSEWRSLATNLENRFHGKSSGMDVAVILAGAPIAFSQAHGAQVLDLQRLPRFTLHDTGMRAQTRDCILKVQSLAQRDPKQARDLDEKMNQASILARGGLKDYDQGFLETGLASLHKAMRMGAECFHAWGLVPPEAENLAQSLLAKGALAVKLTGAGGGGAMVALWDDRLGNFPS